MRKKGKEIETQVLNIDEVRKAEREERQIKHRRLPKKFVALALLLIVVGILYLPVKNFIIKMEKDNINPKGNKSSLTCTINNKDKNGYEVEETTIFNFSDNKLKSYNSLSTISVVKTDEESMKKFKDYYSGLQKNFKSLAEQDGFTGTVEMQNKKIVKDMKVNLEEFSGNDKDKIGGYDLDDSLEDIRKKEESKKAKCK